ncbi:hypothetical protein ACFE04_023716 [Oxalis oulophora]
MSSISSSNNQLLHQPSLEAVDDDDIKLEAEAVIVGGMVLDIHAIPSLPLKPGTTTPGNVNYVLGGVARNIAECMSKLGVKPYMISALGLDMAGIMKHTDIKTPVVSNVLDINGELAAAVASVEAIEKFLTPDWIQKFKSNICSSPILMVDANLSPLALDAACKLAGECNTPVWFEPVSVAKSRRIASIAKHITFTSPNEDELIAMANALSGSDVFHPIDKNNKQSLDQLFHTLRPAILVLLENGINAIILTIGSQGVFLCSKVNPNSIISSSDKFKPNRLYNIMTSSRYPPLNTFQFDKSSHFFAVHLPAVRTSVVRLTGAGDNLVGATLACLCAGLDLIPSVAVGIAAAKATVESETNVPSKFSLATIIDDARRVYSSTKVMYPATKVISML